VSLSENGKTVSESAVITTRLMMPPDANVRGNVFGGVIMKYIDEVAAMVAFRHTRKIAVTASIDRMDFFAPVYIGNLLTLKASVNYVGRTSMEIGVRVEAEDHFTGKTVHTGSCFLTYVALDEGGKPAQIVPVIPQTAEEKRRYQEAEERKETRIAAKQTPQNA
jgi:acyl-CoA hydrolase